jgi:hypothetical protein
MYTRDSGRKKEPELTARQSETHSWTQANCVQRLRGTHVHSNRSRGRTSACASEPGVYLIQRVTALSLTSEDKRMQHRTANRRLRTTSCLQFLCLRSCMCVPAPRTTTTGSWTAFAGASTQLAVGTCLRIASNSTSSIDERKRNVRFTSILPSTPALPHRGSYLMRHSKRHTKYSAPVQGRLSCNWPCK